MKLRFLAALALLCLMFGSAHADEKTFPKPKTAAGFRADWCLTWGGNCGLPAANKFCQNKGYLNATDFDQAPDIGVASPTQVQATGQVCADPTCDGFSQITCSKPDLPAPPPPPPPPGPGGGAAEKTYYKPKIDGSRLNYCETKGSGCGQDAADAFCEAKGYDEADDFEQSQPAPPGAITRYIGNGKKCKGTCYAFNSITCVNN